MSLDCRSDENKPRARTDEVSGEQKKRVLLAEDDATSRKIMGIMLERRNFDVEAASDGCEAVEKWNAGGFDVVLMDVQMPRLDGFRATGLIRELEKKRGGHTPIIAMTAHAMRGDEELCLAAGMDSYVSKPIDFVRLMERIGQVLVAEGK